MPAKKGSVRLCVADEGEGFDWKQLQTCPPPPSTSLRGRGLPVITRLARKVAFNRKGNVIKVEIAARKMRGAH